MDKFQRLMMRRRLERAHKDVVIDLCLRLMEVNTSLTRQLARELIGRPSSEGSHAAPGPEDSSSCEVPASPDHQDHEDVPGALCGHRVQP